MLRGSAINNSGIVTAAYLLIVMFGFTACSSVGRPGQLLERKGDEIMVCGQLFHTGVPVVLWTDPGGYDAYHVEKRFAPMDQSDWDSSKDDIDTPNRYSLRYKGEHFTSDELERIRGGGWDLPLLQRTVDQFVIHYDVCVTSETCFKVLHDHRTLSVHFMLDLDGTIYQTLDLKERAWHAGSANDRSVGIEIANMGGYKSADAKTLKDWYKQGADGRTMITLPPNRGDGGIRTPNFVGHPMRDQPIEGVINGSKLVQYDLTPQQYESLIKLTATLCSIFPEMQCDYPRDADGNLLMRELTDDEFAKFKGLIGHYHETSRKVDPGPAFQWDYVVNEARKYLK